MSEVDVPVEEVRWNPDGTGTVLYERRGSGWERVTPNLLAANEMPGLSAYFAYNLRRSARLREKA